MSRVSVILAFKRVRNRIRSELTRGNKAVYRNVQIGAVCVAAEKALVLAQNSTPTPNIKNVLYIFVHILIHRVSTYPARVLNRFI